MSPRAWRAVGVIVVLDLVIAALIVVGCSGPSGDPPATPTSSSAPTTTPERDAIDLALDRAWDSDAHRFACGAPSTAVTDALADVVQTVADVPRLDAVLAAIDYRRERCPGA